MQESDGHAGPVPTYEDMLQNPHDEDLFEYYATAQLARIDSATGAVTPLGKPSLLDQVNASPDGKDILVSRLHRPFSYLHPAREFPKEVEVWNTAGSLVYKVASLPLPAHVPLGGVETGPRQIHWMANQPATVFWVEALDGGNPKEKVPHRDRMLAIRAPFQGEPAEIFKTEERFAGIQFGSNFALVEDLHRITRMIRTFEIDPSKPNADGKLIWSRNQQDRYKDPGRPVEQRQVVRGFFGASASDSTMLQSGDTILLNGPRRVTAGRPSVSRPIQCGHRQDRAAVPLSGRQIRNCRSRAGRHKVRASSRGARVPPSLPTSICTTGRRKSHSRTSRIPRRSSAASRSNW